mgnify:CR=1 FL=1
MFGKSSSPEKLIASITPAEIDQTHGDPDELATLIVARSGGDHDQIAQALRVVFPEQSSAPPRAPSAAPEHEDATR